MNEFIFGHSQMRGGNASLIPPYWLLSSDKPLYLAISSKEQEDKNKPSPRPSPTGRVYSVILRQRSRCTRDIEIVQTCTVLTKEGARRSTRQIEFCINFSRHSEAQRAERIKPMMADGGQEVRRASEFRG